MWKEDEKLFTEELVMQGILVVFFEEVLGLTQDCITLFSDGEGEVTLLERKKKGHGDREETGELHMYGVQRSTFR